MSVLPPTSTNNFGRPKMRLAHRFRVVAWSHFVKLGSGKRKDAELVKWLSKNGVPLPVGLWSRYMRGEVLPQRSLSGGVEVNTLVKRIDDLVVDSASLFYHPLWDLLDFSRLLSPMELRSLSLKLDASFWPLLIRRQPVLRKGEKPNDFWYRGPLGDDLVNQLDPRSSLVSLEALAMSMVHARMSYCSQDLVSLVKAHLVGCHIMQALQMNQLFVEQERMKSLLLWIEDSCHAQLKGAFRNITDRSKPEWDAYSLLMRLAENHELRVERHIKMLSKSSRSTFAHWRDLV